MITTFSVEQRSPNPEALDHFREEIDLPVVLSRRLEGHIFRAVDSIGGPGRSATLSMRICMRLLQRIWSDLRCARDLSEAANSLQAASLIPGLIENMLRVSHIGSNHNRAENWVRYDDPIHSFGGRIPRLVADVAEKVDFPNKQDLADGIYKAYQKFCGPKHSNPIAERLIGVEANGHVETLFFGPDLSESSIALVWDALHDGSRFALMAVDVFLSDHAPELQAERYVTEVRAIRVLIDRLQAQGSARWTQGEADPYADVWGKVKLTEPRER